MTTTSSTSPTPKTTPANSSGAPVREQLLQAGDVLGHCRVMELIAAGGMANVYKVWHEQLEVIRAIKILKPGFSEEARGRLETEAKISANLRHTNIVEIYGMGYWNDIPYIEMEYIDGPSLKDLLEKNIRLPVQFSLSIVHCVCTALQFAYNQDMTLYGKVYDRLIHRDIKPANILISGRGIVKLADFGIARPSEVSIHTVGSKVMGTFAYLSPEQLNGEKLDQRSDVYSLGTVLYEMLTGAKTFPQKLLAELVQRKTRGQFIPVGSMGIRLPHQLCSAVEKSLALDRSKRFCDAGEFDIEISAVLRKIASKTPEEIIRTYLKNPYSPGLQRKPILDFRAILKITGILLSVVILTLAVIRGNTLMKQLMVRWKPLFFAENIKPAEQPAAASSVVSPPPSATVAPPVTTTDTKSKTTVTKDPLEAAMTKFRNGDYIEAAAEFESLNNEQLTVRQNRQCIIRLLQSYIFSERFEDAYSLTLREPVDDGLFYLLKSQTALQRNQLDVALEAANKALDMTSSFDPALKEKASFQIAQTLHARYMLRPNRENLQNTRDGWEEFINDHCSDGNSSRKCHEAQNKLSLLEH